MRFSSQESIARLFAISPVVLTDSRQWRDLYARLGQDRGGFVLDFPKKWAETVKKLISGDVACDEDDVYEIDCLLNVLIDSNCLVVPPVNSIQPSNIWFDDLKKLIKAQPNLGGKLTKVVSEDLHNIEEGNYSPAMLKPRELNAYFFTPADASPPKGMPWDELDLVNKIELFARQSEICAIVDRYPVFKANQFSLNFLKVLLERTQNSLLHELIIYNSLEEFSKSPVTSGQIGVMLKEALGWSGAEAPSKFEKRDIPPGGIRYVLVRENSSDSDLHMRSFVTKYVSLQLSTSLNHFDKSKSQKIARSTNIDSIETEVARWIDESHGLQVVHSFRINQNGTISVLI